MKETRTRDVFPVTQRTWLGRALVRGHEGLSEANHHIMDVYAQPLKVYYLGSSFRTLGEPDDVVQGFFADRLARELRKLDESFNNRMGPHDGLDHKCQEG